jgi:hypothetical protein
MYEIYDNMILPQTYIGYFVTQIFLLLQSDNHKNAVMSFMLFDLIVHVRLCDLSSVHALQYYLL